MGAGTSYYPIPHCIQNLSAMNRTNRIILSSTVVSAGIVLSLVLALLVRYLLARRISDTTMKQFSNSNLPRGYRNNNPLNLRISPNRWLGKVTDNTDGTFEQFSEMKYGYRAAIKTIQTYINKYGCRTLEQIISRWAPANENNTAAYIANVSHRTGFAPSATIDPHSRTQLTALVAAMSVSENGSTPAPDLSAIQDGWNTL